MALTVPFGAIAQDRHDQESGHDRANPERDGNHGQQTKRYYDKSARDYHEWNQDEDRKYHEYLSEKHMKDRDFDRLNSRDQSAYFKWSHDHDSSLHHDDNRR
jgi:hypothetical protein